MAWVGFYFYLILMAAMNAKLLGACVVAAIGFSVVYPNESYALGIALALGASAVLASFRD